MLWYLIALAIVGLVAGGLARLLVPGPDPMSIVGTIFLGLVGSFVGGVVAGLLLRPSGSDDTFAPVGLIGSTLGAVIVLLLYRSMGGAGGRTARYR